MVQLEVETKVLIIILLAAFSELHDVTDTRFLVYPVHITTLRACRF